MIVVNYCGEVVFAFEYIYIYFRIKEGRIFPSVEYDLFL